jgi:hypothetical protein
MVSVIEIDLTSDLSKCILIAFLGLAVVMHAYNPTEVGVRVRRIVFRSQPQGKKRKTYLKNKLKHKGLEVCLKWRL